MNYLNPTLHPNSSSRYYCANLAHHYNVQVTVGHLLYTFEFFDRWPSSRYLHRHLPDRSNDYWSLLIGGHK